MILSQADTRVHPGSLLHEVNPLQAGKQGNQICKHFSWTTIWTRLGKFYHLIYLRASFLQLLTITDGHEEFFAFLGCWKLIFLFFFFPYGPCRVTHRRAFSQEKQHYMHHALRTASTVTLLRYFMHYLLEKCFTPGTYTHFEKLEIFEHLQGQLA